MLHQFFHKLLLVVLDAEFKLYITMIVINSFPIGGNRKSFIISGTLNLNMSLRHVI